jgi:hypothetical protein
MGWRLGEDMSLVIVVKCKDGIVAATDSRNTICFDKEVPGSCKTEFKDGAFKVFEFCAPHNFITTLYYSYGNINEDCGTLLDPKTDPYSIDSCLRRFENEVLLKAYPHERISISKFRAELENFLIPYWERYREQRLAEFKDLTKAIKDGQIPQLGHLPNVSSNVVIVVTGFDERPSKSHLFVFFLSDASEWWQGSHYINKFKDKEVIATQYGLYFGGIDQFVRQVLGEDGISEAKQNAGQRNSEHLEKMQAQIIAMKSRFNIRFKRVFTYFDYYSTKSINVLDAARLAELLIKGTTEHERLSGDHFVGGTLEFVLSRLGMELRAV